LDNNEKFRIIKTIPEIPCNRCNNKSLRVTIDSEKQAMRITCGYCNSVGRIQFKEILEDLMKKDIMLPKKGYPT